MFLVMATAGLRVGEARAIQWRQVLTADRALLVDRAIKADETVRGTKTGETRVVALPSRALAELEAWREQALWTGPEDLVFPGAAQGIPVSRAAVCHRLAPAMERAGIVGDGRNLVAHSFRHTYNTAMRRLVPGDLLRALTGHKSVEMSDRYDHPALEARLRQIEGAHDAAEKLLGG
jgi:integrase